jgi:hypothetical protein
MDEERDERDDCEDCEDCDDCEPVSETIDSGEDMIELVVERSSDDRRTGAGKRRTNGCTSPVGQVSTVQRSMASCCACFIAQLIAERPGHRPVALAAGVPKARFWGVICGVGSCVILGEIGGKRK